MELSWSTFLLEVLNFLVLVWILKRFLYRPVLDVISRRKQEIQKTLQVAKEEREGGEALRKRYENRLGEWEQERAAARSALQDEIQKERAERLALLANEVAELRRKQKALAEHEGRKNRHRMETEALALAGQFTAKLLNRVAGPDLESRFIEIVEADLSRLYVQQRGALRQALQGASAAVEVTSAFPIDEAEQARLQQALERVTETSVNCRYRQNSRLIAGLRIRVGDWVLHANLRDELKGFTDVLSE